MGKLAHPPLQKLGYSFAVVNFHPQTLITQQDLKQRANSMVYNKYKQIKRDMAKREQQRRLNWFMAVVRVNTFGHKLLRRAREKIRIKNL
jgi:hypothetical protein